VNYFPRGLEIILLEINGSQARIGIESPDEIDILRDELVED